MPFQHIIQQGPSLLTIKERDDPDTGTDRSSAPPPSLHPEKLISGEFPYISDSENPGKQILHLSAVEQIEIERDDDGISRTDLVYPNTILLQLARIKSRKVNGRLTQPDLIALHRLARSFQ